MGRLIRVLVAAMSLGLLVTPSVASAQGKPKLYILEATAYKGEVSSLVAEKADEGLRERLGGDPRVEVLAKYEGDKPKSGGRKPANANLDEAQRLYTAGIGLLVAESWSEAAASFQGSVERFEANLAELESYEILQDALLRLGLAHYKAGTEKEGQEALRLYLALRGDAKVDMSDFPSGMVRFLESEQRALQRQGSGALVIESTPPGAQVVLDGDALGETPMTLNNVAAGVHYVVVRGKGAFPHVERVKVRGRRRVTVKASLSEGGGQSAGVSGAVFMAEIEKRLAASEVDEELNPYLKELSSRTGAQAVTFMVMRKAGSDYEGVPFVYHAEKDALVVLEAEKFTADLTNTTLACYQISGKVIAAISEFPEDKVVSGDPFLVVAAVPTPAPTPAPTPKPEVKPAPKPEVKPAPKPAPRAEVKPAPKPPAAVVTPKPTAPAARVPDEVEREFSSGAGGPLLDDEIADGDKQWYQTWWFWTGVGVVAVSSAVVMGAVLIDDDSETRGFSATINW